MPVHNFLGCPTKLNGVPNKVEELFASLEKKAELVSCWLVGAEVSPAALASFLITCRSDLRDISEEKRGSRLYSVPGTSLRYLVGFFVR